MVTVIFVILLINVIIVIIVSMMKTKKNVQKINALIFVQLVKIKVHVMIDLNAIGIFLINVQSNNVEHHVNFVMIKLLVKMIKKTLYVFIKTLNVNQLRVVLNRQILAAQVKNLALIAIIVVILITVLVMIAQTIVYLFLKVYIVISVVKKSVNGYMIQNGNFVLGKMKPVI